VKALSRSIRRTRAGLKDPKRPSGSFIFAGPSGVGKTELTKALTEFLFGDEDALITLDMSEYSEKHTASRMFGSPPGLRRLRRGRPAHREGAAQAVLGGAVRRDREGSPRHLQLAAADPRRRVGSPTPKGRVVDFKNTVIVMTTNLGTRDISKSVNLGFSRSDDPVGGYEAR
jgi:ATP-dependent Clp protease ATP-binding subunit ClpC